MKHPLLALALLTSVLATPALAVNNYRPLLNPNAPDSMDQVWKEGDYTLPAFPNQPEWVGYFVPLKQDFKYFVDAKSLVISDDGVIHFILRVVSASGAENLSIDGLQCANHTQRTYAFGDSVNKRWIESTRADWRPINPLDPARARLVEDMCPVMFVWPRFISPIY